MRKLSTPLALLSSLLVGCGTVQTTSHTRVATENLAVSALPPADAPIDTRRGDSGRLRTTRVLLRSGEVVTVPGDARLYRDGDRVLVQPGPTSLMVKEFAVEDVRAIEREDVWQDVTTVKQSASPSAVPAAILGVIGVLALSFAVTGSDWFNARDVRIGNPNPWSGDAGGMLR